MIETVSISKMYLKSLIRDSLVLDSLREAGVDNWKGYDWAELPSDEEVLEEVAKIIENGG